MKKLLILLALLALGGVVFMFLKSRNASDSSLDEWTSAARNTASSAGDTAKNTASTVTDVAKSAASTVTETVKDAASSVKDKS
jgi:uncharacterized protein (UPF0333 family)